MGDDFLWALLANIFVIPQSKEEEEDVGGSMDLLTGYLSVFFGGCIPLVLGQDAASLPLNIQYGLPSLGPDGCINGPREPSWNSTMAFVTSC